MARKNFAEEAERDASIVMRFAREESANKRIEGTSRLGGAINIAVQRIEPDPKQIRQSIDSASEEMRELADSIRAHGILQPLTVYYDRDNEVYRIISGERRYHAAKIAGIEILPCLVRDRSPTSSEIKQIQLIENIHRKNMSPLDEAMAYKSLAEEHHLKLDDIAKQVGKSKSYISKAIRLCSLSEHLKTEVATSQPTKKSLSFEHLLEISKKNTPEEQWALYQKIQDGKLNIRELRGELQKQEASEDARRGRPKHVSHKFKDPDGKFLLTVQFKTHVVSSEEVCLALEKALHEARRAL